MLSIKKIGHFPSSEIFWVNKPYFAFVGIEDIYNDRIICINRKENTRNIFLSYTNVVCWCVHWMGICC